MTRCWPSSIATERVADMASDGYHIPDEPRPGGLVRWAVNPVWPFIAVMLGGAWLSWGWFLFNGAAIGSPSRARERLLVAVGLLRHTADLVGHCRLHLHRPRAISPRPEKRALPSRVEPGLLARNLFELSCLGYFSCSC